MLTVTEAKPEEYNIIQQIVHITWPIAYGEILSKTQLDYMLALFYSLEALQNNVKNGHHFFFAKEDDKVLGFMGIEHNYNNDKATKIHKIYILPEAQGKGVGKLLIQKAEEQAKLNNLNKLSLNVNRQNKAQAFYRKLGFEIIAQEDIEIGEGYLMEDFIMEKAI